MAPNSNFKRYNLVGGENSYSSISSTSESDARRLQSLIPSLSGALERERPLVALTTDAAFPSRVCFFHQFKRNNNGVFAYYFFCATATTLYQLSTFPAGSWQAVTAVGTLAAFPSAVNINNLMHFTDGVSNWIFDGTNWVKEGLAIPLHAPVIQSATPSAAVSITSISRTNGVVTMVVASIPNISGGLGTFNIGPGGYLALAGVSDATFNQTYQVVTQVGTTYTFSQPGFPDSSPGASGTAVATSFNVLSNRYYWTTFADKSSTHPHESSSSPISLGTGALTGKDVFVLPRPGTVTVSASSVNVVGVGTDFNQNDVGLCLFVYPGSVQIASVQDAQHLTLVAHPPFNESAVLYFIAPLRTTHINLYASSSEEDKIGSLLASVPFVALTNPIIDQSPMIGTPGAYFTNVQRPLLNDPPNASTIEEVHKNRIWRRLETFPQYFTYTGFEEILAEQAGAPQECVPGQDPNTVSTGQVNETPLPDSAVHIRGFKSHGDAMYIGSDVNVIPLYGSSLADFQLSNAQAFAVGFAGKRLVASTPFGLAFLSYDLKVYLYPSQYSFGVDSTTALIELGRPKRPEFENIDGTDFDNGTLISYNWGRRNWLVLSYRRNDQTFQTWVFDFEVKGWFQLQTGYTQTYVFEFTPGKKTLVGANSADNKIYIIDDRTGTFPVPGGTNYPPGTFRQIIDFGEPNSNFVLKPIEFETSDPTMEVDVSVWLDPDDPDNPTTTKIPIAMSLTTIGRNRFKGQLNSDTGATCQRALVEFAVASSPVNGQLRGFSIFSDKLPADPVM